MIRPFMHLLEGRRLLSTAVPAAVAGVIPDAHNTGPTGPLQVVEGDVEITVDGTVLRDVDVRGSIRVRASHVRLLNFRAESVKFFHAASAGGHRDLLIEDGEITSPNRGTGIVGGYMVVRRTEVHHMGSDAFNVQTDTLLEGNYVHHLGMTEGAHADGVSSSSHDGLPVTGIVIRGNNFDMGSHVSRGRANARPQYTGFRSNGAIFVGLVGGMVVENNWLNGGNFTVNSGLDGSTFVYRGNRFGREFNFGTRRTHGLQQFTATNWVDNVWADNGKPTLTTDTTPTTSPAPPPPAPADSPGAWTPLGPGPLLTGDARTRTAAGRVAAIAAHPSDPNTLYAGGAAGGVWKTTDGGTSWTPLTDAQGSLAISDIAIAPSSPPTLYAGTGELANPAVGRGILKSSDGGTNWTLVGSAQFAGQVITKLLVHPTDANVVYAAVTGPGANGVYKSIDGGQTWANTTSGLATTAAYTDLAISPSDPSRLVAAADGLYVSTNGGTSWAAATGAPAGTSVGNARVAFAPSNGQLAYAVMSTSTDGTPLAVVQSTDGGVTWSALPPLPSGVFGNRGRYDFSLAVDPANSGTVYLGGAHQLLRSTDAGQTWADVDTAASGRGTHPYHRGAGFDASGRLIVATDGGVWRVDGTGAGGLVWTNLNANLAVAEVTGVGVHPTSPRAVLAGTIGNGTGSIDDDSPWSVRENGDGGDAAFSPTDPNRAYHVAPVASFGVHNFFRRSDDGGVTWRSAVTGLNGADPMRTNAPFAVHPDDGEFLLLGTNRVYRSLNGADSWSPLSTPGANGWTTSDPIDAVAFAPSDSDVIYATAGGHVFVTTNGGATWAQRDLPNGATVPVGDLLVQSASSAAAFAVAGTRVWQTINGGTTWQDITGDLPAVTVRAVARDGEGALYVGTDAGVYRSANGGATWTSFGTGLPNAPVSDLEVSADRLTAATLGRGVFQILLSGTGAVPPAPPTLGPDPFGYAAAATTFANIDLVPGTAGVFTILDGDDDDADDVNMLSNTFTFYGVTYNDDSPVWVSDNGLITFGIGELSPANNGLGGPFAPMIAPLWDDWRTDLSASGATSDRVLGKFEDTTGDGVSDRLILEWNGVRHYHGAPSAVTFQAILQVNTGTAPGAITFNYPDLDTGDGNTGGAGATVGIKDAGTARRLLVSRDAAPGPLVGTGRAIRIVAPDADAPAAAVRPVVPRSAPLDSVTIVFDEPVSGLNVADFTLTRDGSPTNLLTGAETLVTTDNRMTWVLSGLSSATTALGDYVLTLNANGSGIADDSTNALAAGAATGWTNTLAATIGSFTVVPDPVVGGQSLTLTAQDVVDADGSIAGVTFYRESNGTAGLQVGAGGDAVFAVATGGPDDWSAAVPTVGLAGGQHTFYARAVDDDGAPGATTPSATITLTNDAPVLTGLSLNPNPVFSGDDFVITALGVSDPDNAVVVRYYRESNNVPGLQFVDSDLGEADDLIATSALGGPYAQTIATVDVARGTYTYYAQATDTQGAQSVVVEATGAVVNHPPAIGSLGGSPDPVAPGNDLTLTATGVDDPDGSVAIVEFYRESNTTAGLQTGAGGDVLVGSDVGSSGGWKDVVTTVGLPDGTHTYYARALDGDGASSAVVSFDSVVVNSAPSIGSVSASPSPATQGATVTLTATGVTDPDSPLLTVRFYRETNGTTGLQTGTGGDALVAEDAAGPTYSRTFSTTGLASGTYTYYAQATDAGNLAGNVVSTTHAVTNDPPVIVSLTTSPEPVARGNNLTLTANSVSDADHSVEFVTFYREGNGTPGLQPDDTLVGTDQNASGGGWLFTFDTDVLPTGSAFTFYARATDDQGLAGNVVSATANLSTAPSLAPTSVNLLAGSDTGTLDNDELTNLDNSSPAKALVFGVGGARAGATVTLYADGVAIGNAVAAANGTVNITTNGTVDLSDGAHVITARQTEPGKDQSVDSPSLTITIDTAPPVGSADIIDVSPDPRTTEVDQVTIVFESAVPDLTLSDLTLRLNGGADRLPGSGAVLTSGDGGVTWILSNLAGATAAAGTFTLALAAGAVTDAAGNGLAGGDVTETWVVSSFVPVYKQDTGPDGLISIDVNANDGNLTRNGKTWTTVAGSAYTGGSALQVLPSTGTRYGSNAPTAAPQLDFRVKFNVAGTYYLWVRGTGPTSDDDSLHAGLNGVLPTTSDEIDKIRATLGWSRTTADSPAAFFTVPSAGVHTVNLWMREDGLILDKLVLTTNPNYVASGEGPALSLRGGLTNLLPTIGSLSASPEPVNQGQSLTLTANSVADPDGTVSAVEFYRDSDGNSVFDPGTDTLLGTDASATGGWTLSTPTASLAPGGYRYFARALDNHGAPGAAATATSTVQPPAANNPPTVGSLGASPEPVTQGQPLTLTANPVSDSDGSVALVEFYRDSNGNGAFDAGGDTLLGTDSSSAGGWTLGVATAALAEGTHRFFAQAQDDDGAVSNVVTTTSTVAPPATGGGTGPYLQDAGADGLVVVEAEGNDGLITRGGKTWTPVANAAYSGGSGLQALPNTGTSIGSNAPTAASQIDFKVKFNRTGVHYIWVRGVGPTGKDDSVHVGLDGVLAGSSDKIDKFLTAPTWSKSTADGTVAQVNVTSIGLHTINVWMREDGFIFDKLVLTTSSTYAPTGTGPAASVRDGGGPPPPPTAPTVSIGNVQVTEGAAGGTTTATFQVTLSAASASEVTVEYSTADNTATVANADYVARPLTLLTFAAGQTTQTITVTVNGDAAVEPSETFLVNLVNPVGATLLTSQGVGTITNDDSPGGGGTGAFQQDGGADGIVSIEAESFDANTPRAGKSWATVAGGGYSGGSAMQNGPNTGTLIGNSVPTTSPQLDYQVNFTRTGIHYVWLLGSAPTDKDDSAHVGIDGALPPSSDKIQGFGPVPAWSKETADGPVATINVTSIGVHTINVWMREDGFVFDKIVLTTSSAYTPTGGGPPSSPRAA